jgi:Holliday junction resolvasome RuvABC endonuclease subunit
MKAVGFNFTKNDFRFCVLDGETNPPSIIDKGKIICPNNMNTSELMAWFETQLELIIDKYVPDTISHKVSLNIKKLNQIETSCYPQAILNLIAKKKNISTKSYSTQAINATKFGKARGVNVFEYVDSMIGEHKPYWDKATKEAVLVAWFNLL